MADHDVESSRLSFEAAGDTGLQGELNRNGAGREGRSRMRRTELEEKDGAGQEGRSRTEQNGAGRGVGSYIKASREKKQDGWL